MGFVKYTPQYYPALAVAARKVNVASLLHRDFVDYYYYGQPWSELYLAFDDDGSCIAFIGYDRLRFEHEGQEIPIGMATNFYTLKPGVGGFLWLQWMKSCGAGIVFGGSEDTHRIVRKQKFTYYQGVNVYTMNARYSSYKSDPTWKKGIKRVLRTVTRKPLKAYDTSIFRGEAAGVVVKEIPSGQGRGIDSNCFSFRFSPPDDYLHWRYNSDLKFVKYRWFEILAAEDRVGYCVLNDSPDQVIVAHSDGTDPVKLAYGILKAVFMAAETGKQDRTALLVSSHPVMQTIFVRHGSDLDVADRPMAIGSLKSTLTLGDPQDWLINFGWGDNDLRPSTFTGAVPSNREGRAPEVTPADSLDVVVKNARSNPVERNDRDSGS